MQEWRIIMKNVFDMLQHRRNPKRTKLEASNDTVL